MDFLWCQILTGWKEEWSKECSQAAAWDEGNIDNAQPYPCSALVSLYTATHRGIFLEVSFDEAPDVVLRAFVLPQALTRGTLCSSVMLGFNPSLWFHNFNFLWVFDSCYFVALIFFQSILILTLLGTWWGQTQIDDCSLLGLPEAWPFCNLWLFPENMFMDSAGCWNIFSSLFSSSPSLWWRREWALQ